jgi:cytochrome P450
LENAVLTPGETFRSINTDFALLGLGVLPSILARKGYWGREKLFQSFRDYYNKDAHLTGSPLVQARFEVNRKHGISIDDIAHFELSVCIGLLVNTVPSTFWCIYDIYSRPDLLEEVRRGITSSSTRTSDTKGVPSYSVDIAELLTEFPLLQAIVRETLRILSTNASGRVLLKDTMLDDRYLLKKDALLLLPSAELHNNTAVWGEDFAEFNPKRWFRSGIKSTSPAYRAFGGGSSLCPGRHLSMNEIMVAIVVMVMKYDLVPTGNKWKSLKTRSHITTSILMPQDDIEVEVIDRTDRDQVHWSFTWKGLEL